MLPGLTMGLPANVRTLRFGFTALRVVALVALLVLLAACSNPTPTPPFGLPPVALPADEAAHEFQTEWWYFNAHLTSAAGGRTIAVPERWALHQVLFQVQATESGRTLYVGQVGLANFGAGTHATGERLRTEEAPLPTRQDGFRFELAGWLFEGSGGTEYRLRGDAQGTAFDLTLRSTAPPLLHGQAGLVDFGAAGVSYYYSRPRLEVSGTVTRADGLTTIVEGTAWFDKQWGDFQPVAVGWDWASVQLDDGRDLMLSRLFGLDGTPIRTYATLGQADGVTGLDDSQFSFVPAGGDTWVSDVTGAAYPTRWRVRVPGERLDFDLIPSVVTSEFRSAGLGVVYWEAGADAISIEGRRIGQGFIELTGRAGQSVPAAAP